MPAPPSTDQDEARLAAQQATGIEFFPGTELMKDINNVHLKRTGTETLVPHPSDDPADPVNWSRTWKWLTMSSMVLSTFNWVFSPLALGPQVPYYMESFNSTLPEVINFTGVSILVLGFTNLIWVPFARGFGRRPMAILTTMITTVSCIWRARATSYNSFLGAAILCGVGASPGETLGPVLIADVMLLHERGWWMGMYQWAFMGGLMIGPIIAGVTADLYGWQSFWWIATAISVFTNVWIIFFLPETKWDRRGLDASTVNAARLESPSINAGTEKMQVSNSEQSVVDAAHVEHSSDTPNENLDPSLSGRPNRLQFLPIAPWRAHESILNAIVLPFKLIRFPIVLWGACQFTCACSCYLMISITQSQALGAPPFNFTAAQVGYTNLGMFVGTSIALLTAGPLGDWMSRRATIRNNGVREPEMRLPALVPFAVCFLVGCVVVSVGFQNGWAWEVVVVVGFGLVGVQVAAIFCTGRLLPTRGGGVPRRSDRHQECLGLWHEQIHQQLDRGDWVCWSFDDDHCYERRFACVWRIAVVFLWQEGEGVVGGELCSSGWMMIPRDETVALDTKEDRADKIWGQHDYPELYKSNAVLSR